MAYDEHLADRIRTVFQKQHQITEEKKMMGGLCYMLNEKMCAGIINDSLMARIDPDFYQDALKIDGCREMDFTGRAMKGFVYVDAEAIDDDDELEFWISKCIEFNPKAKSSKKKKK